MEEADLIRLIDERVEDRLKKGLGQFDIEPGVIKERHVDWESMENTVNNSIIQKITDLIYISETASASATVADGADDSITVTVSDDSGNDDRIIFGVIGSSAYETSVAAANAIPHGGDLAAGDYVRLAWHDWGSTDNKNLTLVDYVDNGSGGEVSVLWRVHVRYIGQSTT